MVSSLLLVLICTVVYTAGISAFFQCDFEKVDICGFKSSSSNYTDTGEAPNWRRHTGTTPSAKDQNNAHVTGPLEAQSGDYYMYFEASNLPSGASSTGTLTSRLFDATQFGVTDIVFHVSSKGESLSLLVLDFIDYTTNDIFDEKVVFPRNKAAWQKYTFNLDEKIFKRKFYMQFIGYVREVNGKKDNGDWAIDNLRIDGIAIVEKCENVKCNVNTNCKDTSNGPNCECLPGYSTKAGTSGKNTECIETCQAFTCNLNAECSNTENGPDCKCESGYKAINGTSGKTTRCEDDTCSNFQCSNNTNCENTVSGPNCTCKEGYRPVNGTRGRDTICEDINECAIKNICGGLKVCRNVPGSHHCDCPPNYTFFAAENKCYRNGAFSQWRNVGSCSKTCGAGDQKQTRSCSNPSREAPHGRDCPNEPTERAVACNSGPCLAGCPRNKTCTCENVRQYKTGEEPKKDFSSFNGLSITDGETSRRYVHTYNREFIEKTIKDVNCNNNQLKSVYKNITDIIGILEGINKKYSSTKMEMQDIIDCNANIDIEKNLWDVYDVLAEHSICNYQVQKDLEMKADRIQAEITRCNNRGWYSTILDAII